MATKATRYGFNGGYQSNYAGSNADNEAKETAKNVKSAKRAIKVAVLAVAAMAIMASTSGCNSDVVINGINSSVKQSIGVQNNAVDVLMGTTHSSK